MSVYTRKSIAIITAIQGGIIVSNVESLLLRILTISIITLLCLYILPQENQEKYDELKKDYKSLAKEYVKLFNFCDEVMELLTSLEKEIKGEKENECGID